MASAFSLGGLTAYAKEHADEYLSSLITGAKTIEILQSEGNIQTGIKTTDKINILEASAVWQEGDGCGFSASGSTAITQRTITVGNIKINVEWCMDNLIPYYNQVKMQRGSMGNLEKFPEPLEAAILDRLLAKQKRDMEIAVWKGDTASGDTQLQHFDGFMKIIDAAGAATWSNLTTGVGTVTAATNSTTVSGSGTDFTSPSLVGAKLYNATGVYVGTVASVTDADTLVLGANAAVAIAGAAFKYILPADFATSTTSNVDDRIDAIYAAIPTQVLNADGARLWIGEDQARTYQRYLTAANLFNYKADGNFITDGFILPGTSLKIQPTPGLNSTGRMYVIDPKNMIFGTDLENEYEKFHVWYNEEDEMLRLKARWRAGVQVAFPAEITGNLG